MWQSWIDPGGTFTDIVARDTDAALVSNDGCWSISSGIPTPPCKVSATC